ncbi:MAG: type I secretion system permease/ATPase [Gammaproteobacteria bacterium]|nr:type I secretion system permease/ATPase [Gammaproteobacteria bacterium]
MHTHAQSNQRKSQQVFDPLLECLLALAKYYGHSVSPNTLTANLPLVNHKLTPALFVQAAARIQLTARIVERSLDTVNELVLPAVLLLKDDKACILTKLYGDETAEFILPQAVGNPSVTQLPLKEVSQDYTGIAIYTKPEYFFEKRADEYQVVTARSWFWDTFWRYRSLYYQVALATFFINCFVLASPLFVMNVYDRVVPNQTMGTLWVLTIGIVIIYVFDLLLKIIRGYLLDVSGKKADVVLSDILFNHLLELKLSSKPISAGAFANSFQGYESVRDFFTSATLVSLIDLPFVFLFLIVIAYIGGWIVLIPFMAIPLVVIVSLYLEIPIRNSVEQSFVGMAQKNAILIESINQLETIKSSASEGEYQRKWEYYSGLVARLGMKSRFYSSLAVNFAGFVLAMVYVLVIVAGVYAITENNLTLGALIACAILSSRTMAPLTQIASLITRYHQAKTGLQTLNRIMALPTEREDRKNYLYHPQLRGDVQFENVSFTYPNQQILALNKLSFTIKANEKVAILGRIGSGKSTVLKLIIGLYQSFSGSILLDDIDIHQLDPADIRRNIGYAPQESSLFYGTLRENICKSMPWASADDIQKVADITGISHYTNHHPSGFDLMIGENGAGLSRGQQQSVAIARAILPNAPLLLLDDTTSEMDDNSEQELRDKLKDYVKDKTLIMVTHKLSMLSLVDRIIILQNGQLVADGPKDEVLKKLVH